eukprot:8260-Heterococcus_DN1.PRE.4
MEFSSANKAYQETPYVGFRTFLKGKRDGDKDYFLHQPFFPEAQADTCEVTTPSRDMLVGMNELEIREENPALGLNTKVQYFTLPEEDFAGLVRRATFTYVPAPKLHTNTDETKPLELQILDGMPKLEPFGVTDWHLKSYLRRHQNPIIAYGMSMQFTRALQQQQQQCIFHGTLAMS